VVGDFDSCLFLWGKGKKWAKKSDYEKLKKNEKKFVWG